MLSHAVGVPSDILWSPYDNKIKSENYAKQKAGWFINLPSAGERVITDANIRGGRVIFTTMIPDTLTCAINTGTGWVMELDVNNGNRIDGITFDTNSNGLLTKDDLVNQTNTTGRFINAIPSQPKFLKRATPLGSQPLENKYINSSNATVESIVETSAGGLEGRIQWKKISPPSIQ